MTNVVLRLGLNRDCCGYANLPLSVLDVAIRQGYYSLTQLVGLRPCFQHEVMLTGRRLYG
jgi:hypothetical protein